MELYAVFYMTNKVNIGYNVVRQLVVFEKQISKKSLFLILRLQV